MNSDNTQFVIAGGGTTGWLLAHYLLRRFPKHTYPSVGIHLIEAPDIATIGVGEGSIPIMNTAFESLGILDPDWMPACDATYKLGIDFRGWGREPDYFHSFHLNFSEHVWPFFMHEGTILTRVDCRFLDAMDNPSLDRVMNTRFYLSPERCAAIEAVAYHFDAGLLANYLKRRAIELGLEYHRDTIVDVEQHENGDLARLHLRSRAALDGDYFLDCTGFHARLVETTLGIPFLPERSLLCDRAVTARIPRPGVNASRALLFTTSTTGSAGWFWQIPLVGKDGCGYVYSSDVIDDEHAQAEFQAFLERTYGIAVPDHDFRTLRFRSGRRDESWRHNCVGFGLADNFIEPLEATAISMTISRIAGFLLALGRIKKGADPAAERAEYNRQGVRFFDDTCDFIIAHYRTAARDDTPFWRANHRDIVIPESLQRRLNDWTERRFVYHNDGVFYPASWFSIFVGQGYRV